MISPDNSPVRAGQKAGHTRSRAAPGECAARSSLRALRTVANAMLSLRANSGISVRAYTARHRGARNATVGARCHVKHGKKSVRQSARPPRIGTSADRLQTGLVCPVYKAAAQDADELSRLAAVAAIEEAIGRGTPFALHGLAGTGKTTAAARAARTRASEAPLSGSHWLACAIRRHIN